jgi:hypothetical protein
VLDNPFNQRVNAVIQKSREMRRGVYYPQLYIVKEDGEMPLRLWALSLLIQDRADVMPSYQQFITQLKDKVLHNLVLGLLTFDLFRSHFRSTVLATAMVTERARGVDQGGFVFVLDSHKYYLFRPQ